MVSLSVRKPRYPTLVRKTTPVAAGIVVRAADTGRVLMLQRSISDRSDPAAGKWEFPGGCLENGETPDEGAVREWQEETGCQLPKGEYAGHWQNGPYHGCVYVIPHEADVQLNLDASDRAVTNPDDPDGDDYEVLAWWPPTQAQSNPALRNEVSGADWALIHGAVPDATFKSDRRYPRLVKEQPAVSDVHVDVPLSDTSIGTDNGKRKKKPQTIDEPELAVKILKADKAKQLVYGIVLEPHAVDSQGDWEDEDDIEKACHRYLGVAFEDGATDLVNLQHRWQAPAGVHPVENYIAPIDFELNGEPVKKGSWVLVVKVGDPQTWQQVLDGEWGGLSVEGTGRRNYARPSPKR